MLGSEGIGRPGYASGCTCVSFSWMVLQLCRRMLQCMLLLHVQASQASPWSCIELQVALQPRMGAGSGVGQSCMQQPLDRIEMD
jgi:hypothetical protein